MEPELRPKKRLGRVRGVKLGFIVTIRGGSLPVKVRVRLESLRRHESLEASALLNTGFNSETLDIHLPFP